MMRGILPGCPCGEDQIVADRAAAAEAQLDEMVQVEIRLDISRATVHEVVSMSRRRFQELQREDDISGLFLHLDTGDIDFDDWDVDVKQLAICGETYGGNVDER